MKFKGSYSSTSHEAKQKSHRSNTTPARLISLLLALVLVATMVPAMAFATSTEEPVGGGAEQGASSVEGEGVEDGVGSGADSDSLAGQENVSGGDLATGTETNTDGTLDNANSSNPGGEVDTSLASDGTVVDALQAQQLSLNDVAGTDDTEMGTLSTATDFTQIYTELSKSTVQTYYDYKTKSNSTDAQLTVTLQVQPTDKYVSGGRIELPLDYNPAYQTAANTGIADFNYGTSGSNGLDDAEPTPDFFFLDETKLVNAIGLNTSIVESYDLKSKPGTLILNLKSAADYAAATNGSIVGLKSLQLNFSFNNAYDMKVPVGATMWQPLPTVYAGTDTNGLPAVAKAVKTSASHELTVSMTRRDPSDENYFGGGLTNRFIHNNYYYYESDFDTTAGVANRIWIEVPEGTEFTSANVTTVLYPDGSSTANGYTRYYRNVKNDEASWNYWHYTDNEWDTFNQRDIAMVIPDTITESKKFELRLGADYTKLNGVEKTVSHSISYTKQGRPVWAPHFPVAHSTGGSVQMICGVEKDNISQTSNKAPMANWGSNALKNLGSGSVTGVEYVLYQASKDSSKVNFNTVIFYALRDASDASVTYPWSSYRYEVYVTKVGGSEVCKVSNSLTPSAAGGSASYYLVLPALGSGEYISKIKVIPTGINGAKDGEWVSMNGFALQYTAKAWDTKTWPDGTAVPSTQTIVPMEWKISYDHNPSAPNAYPENGEGVTNITTKPVEGKVYYSSQPYAQANMTSLQASGGVNPGDTVDYVLYGYNNALNTVGSWDNPQVIVRVPNAMTLKSKSGLLLTDLTPAGGTTSVNVTSLGEHDGYNYYSFAAQGYSAPEVQGQTAVFSIPLQFEVSAAAAPKIYPAPQVVSTTTTPSAFWGSYNLPRDGALGADRSFYGLIDGDHYSISNIVSSVLNVLPFPSLDAGSGVRSSVTGGAYVTSEVVPAAHGETTSMKLTIANSGNVDFTNVRLYNILPYDGDELLSNGSISFENLSVEGIAPTMYYTTADPKTIPLYGEHGTATTGATGAANLQESTFQESWSQTAPASGTTAFFLDFGTYILKPGEKIEIMLNFKVPGQDLGDQTAYNQFAYSAKQVNSDAAPLNQVPSKQGFSTASMGILYNPKLPAVYDTGGKLEGKGAIEGMPADKTGSYTPAENQLTVDSKTPTLVGFKFLGWDTNSAASTVVCAPSATITFDAAGTRILYPVWEIQKYEVSYSYTNTAPDMPALPTDSQVPFANDVAVAKKPQLAGYSFNGWIVKSGGVSAATGTFVMPGNNVELEGTWTPNATTPYTVEHYKVNSLGVAAKVEADTQTFTGTTDTISPDAQENTYPGYSYHPKYKNNGDVEVLNGRITADGKLTLKLYYTVHTNDVTYSYSKNSQGEDAPVNAPNAALNNRSKVEFGTKMTVAAKPTLTGYTFNGWDTSDVTYTGSAYSMPDNPVAFSGSWTANAYNLAYNANGGSGAVPAGHKITFDKEFTVADAAGISRQGYTFAGWNTQANGSGMAFTENQVVKCAFTNDVTLYAQWDPASGIAYTVEHYLVDASGNARLDFTEQRTGTTNATVYAGQRSYAPTHSYNANYPGSVASGQVKADGTLTLKLYYTLNTYTVTFVDYNGATLASRTGVPYGGDALAPANPFRTGYTFTGWDRGYTNVTADIVVTALYTPLTFTVTFVDGQGTTLQSSTVVYGGGVTPPANPTRTGYTFAGWDLSSAAWTNVTSNALITAQWTPVEAPVVETPTPAPTPTPTTPSTVTPVPTEVTTTTTTPGTPTMNIFGSDVPLFGAEGTWSLFDLLCAMAALVALAITLVLAFSRKKRVDEATGHKRGYKRIEGMWINEDGLIVDEREEGKRHTRKPWMILLAVVAVVLAVLFVLTQDMTLNMALFDSWSIVFGIGLIVGILAAIFTFRRVKVADEEEPELQAI